MSKLSRVYGIDLGTTYSCIAYVNENGESITIPTLTGELTTASVIRFIGSERIVGKEAKNDAAKYPDNTISMIKRQMGKNDFTFVYNGSNYTPEEISSYILRKVVQDAEQVTGFKITDVVITCPAYFGIPEREATAKAGEIAGLKVRSIINEPTAAAISYGVTKQDDQVVLVYDLGGGTFDTTILEIKGGNNITVICTDGDHFLGGRNWDEAVIIYLAEEWQKQTGSIEDPLEVLETQEDLFDKAETAKYALTQREKSDIRVVHNGQTARVTLTREKFDELTAPLLDRTIELTKQALAEAKKRGYDKFDQLLLVGGSTRMPQVAQRLQREFNVEPKMFEPDEAVAKGAAIYGQKLALDQEIVIRIADAMGVAEENVNIETVDPKVLAQAQQEVARDLGLQIGSVKDLTSKAIRNVTSRSFGIIVWDSKQQRDIVSNLILRNDPVPADITKRYGTKDPNQDSVLLQIVDNLSSDVEYDPDGSRKIGDAELLLPQGLPANAPLDITFKLDEQARLHMHARELSGGKEVEVTIQTEAGSSVDAIEQAKERAKTIVVSNKVSILQEQPEAASKHENRPNYFELLDIDPYKTWDDADFKSVLAAKRAEWTKQSRNPKNTKLYLGYLEMVSKILAVMSDPILRAQEAVEAQKRAIYQGSDQVSSFNLVTVNPIFISYRRSDWDMFVNPLVGRLRAEGLSVWVDQHLLEGGDDWLDEINKALRVCERMILCVSPEALESRHVKLEYRYFFNNGKKIFPLVCREAELPAELQTIQYYPFKRLEDLIRVLKK